MRKTHVMKKQYLFIVAILVSLCGNLFSQTYQLSGNPVNTTGWSLVSSAIVSGDFIRLTDNQTNTSGGIKLNAPINLKYCNKWKVEFDFRIDGAGNPTYGKGDGLAFWYITNPPTSYISGGGLGIPNNAEGLMIGFDTYNNYTESLMSKVHILYGTNNVSSNIEMNNTTGSTYHSNDLLSTIPFITGNYRHVEVNGEIDPANAANWIITVKIDNQQIVSQSFQPSGGAVNMTQGYFGFSASTGGATSRHSIKNAKIYVDKVSLLQNTITATKCVNASSSATVDLTSFNSQLVSNPANYIFTYYILGSSTPISNPTNFQYSTNTTIKVIIKDPTSTLCDTEAQIQLNTTTLSPPTITSSSNTICFGGNVTLTSSQATGNTWSTGATTPSITVTTPGTYTVTNTNGGCTSAPASITITAESNPNVQITGNTVLCESPTQLTASASGTGNTYTWSNGSTGNTISVSTAGTYTVTVKTPANCEYQKSITVTQGVVPVVQNSSLSQCSNSSTAIFNLTSAQTAISTTSGVTFDFYLNQADAVAGNSNTINNPTTYTSGNTTIYVRVKSATCAKVAQLQLTINTNAAPTITASGPAICNGNGVTLTSNASTGNVWSTGATTQSITVTTAGTYTLTNNNGTCTSSAASFTVVNGVDPNLQITGNLTFCENSSTILTATAQGTGNTFSWSNGTTGATATITSPGTYTVTVTTSLGCQYQKSVTVTMDPLIVVNIANPAQITCTNPQIMLDATSSVYQAGATYLWTASGGGNIVSGANTLTPTVNNGGTYTLKITSATPNGCVKQASVNVVKNTSPPTIILTSSKMTICKGESAIITASGAVNYVWAGLSGSGNTQTVTPLTTTTYSVTGTGANGCISSAPTTITINVVPEITSILQDTEICEGHKANLDAGTALSGPSYTYSWSTGETTQVIHPTAAGTYSVTISNGFCSKTFSAKVSYTIVPEILEIVYNNNSLTIKAKNNSPLPLEYSIDNGVIWQASNVFTNVLKNTQYPIRVRNRGILCDAYTEYYTFVLSNAITPNGDGINDVLDLTPLSKYKNFTGSIFDRYGKEIFKASAKNTIWDGKYIGREAPTGTYWYKLSWEDPVTKKTIMLNGWVLLKNRD